MDYKNNIQGSALNQPGGKNASLPIQKANQMPIYQTDMMPAQKASPANQAVFPEIYYKLQPHIMMICDQMDTFGSEMPSQEMIEQLTDTIYDDVNRMYPDLTEYAREQENKMNTASGAEAKETIIIGGGYAYPDYGYSDSDYDYGYGRGYGRRRRFRRRGLLRDIIDILLLSELRRRRRRPYYDYYY